MKLISQRSRLKGTVCIPASKSHTIRAVAIACLAEGTSLIRRPLISNDTLSAVSTYKALGADIDTSDDGSWKVRGNAGSITCPTDQIDVGNSGTTLRIAVGSAALAPSKCKIMLTGDEQIRTRPLIALLKSLDELGASCRSIKDNGRAPVEVTGGLQGGHTSIAAFTSQFLTSLLMCTPLAPTDSIIDVTLLNEPGYVQMTLDWLDLQGIKYENKDFKKFFIPGGQKYIPFDRPIPADFSSATFFLCAAAIFGDDVTITGLDLNDSQPDKQVIEYLKAMGADIEVKQDSITIKGGELEGIEIDMNATPDALPAMAVTAAFANGTTKLINVPQARSKETDRIACMARELEKLGANIEELPDGLIIKQSTLKPTAVNGYDDHRIVMALSLAGFACDKPIEVDTAQAINVTFPDFVTLMQQIGANMQLQDRR